MHIAFRLARCSFCARLRTRPCTRLRAHTHGYAQNAHTCEADIKRIHTYARARYGSFSLSFSFSRTRRSFFPPRPEFDKFICLCGAIGSRQQQQRQQQLAAATTVSPSPPPLSSSSPPTLGKSTMRKGARDKGTTDDGFLSADAEIAMRSRLRRVDLVFIGMGIRLALKWGGRRRRRRGGRGGRGFVQSSDETKSASG